MYRRKNKNARRKGQQMNIEVMIPVVTPSVADRLLESIESNTILPVVHIIDNTSEGLYAPSSGKFEIIRHRSPFGNTGVNKAWNWAKDEFFRIADVGCFLNDDIVLNKYYFENLVERFKHQRSIMALVPAVQTESPAVLKHTRTGKLEKLIKRQGCCFALRKTLLDKLPSIPKDLKTFYGDNFWLEHSKRLGHHWYIDQGNHIYHEVGVAVKALDLREELGKEKMVFIDAMKRA